MDEDKCELLADTLCGDLVSFVIDQLRNSECAYRYLPEHEQKELIATAQRNVRNMVGKAVRLIAAAGRASIPVTIKKVVNTGSEIQALAVASRIDPLRNNLFDLAGFGAVIVVADTDRFGGGEVPQPEPDQQPLFDAGEE